MTKKKFIKVICLFMFKLTVINFMQKKIAIFSKYFRFKKLLLENYYITNRN